MNAPVDFIFGVHFHQPVGNFRSVLENSYNDAYRPFIETFKKFKKIKLNLHISSPLLEYFNKKHPDFISSIREEVERGSIEMISGGFYEPILVTIPRRDIDGQIKMMSSYLQKKFNTVPRGIWLTERVWEPHIPTLLKKTGIQYLAVDDTHFIQAGFPPQDLNGYYITEDRGNKLGIFIINKRLRYLIPFKLPKTIIRTLKDFGAKAEKGVTPLLSMLDDGEKFGVWPNTKEWVYDKKWLNNFFKSLEENSSWLKTYTLSDYYDSHPPKDIAYLPASSYYEMLEWSMPTEGALKIKEIKSNLKKKGLFEKVDPYLTGGIWKNFFFKYPESNYMHKRMLYMSNLLDKSAGNFNDEKLKEKAYRYLYKSQCSCSYWHGVFGGIYLSHLRNAIYENLIKLQKILDSLNHGNKQFLEVCNTDLDADGCEEIIINSDKLFIAVKPSRGGAIEEITDKKTDFNQLNTIARRKEHYYDKIIGPMKPELTINSKESRDSEEGIGSIHEKHSANYSKYKKYLVYDKYPRKGFIDHIFPKNIKLKDFKKNKYSSPSLFTLPYTFNIKNKKGGVSLTMERDFEFLNTEGHITKIIKARQGKRSFNQTIRIKNNSDNPFDNYYAVEYNFSLLTNQSREKYYIYGRNKKVNLSETKCLNNIVSVGVADESQDFKIILKPNLQANAWIFPINTVTNSEAGFELTYQASSIVILFPLKLGPGENFKAELQYLIESL